MRKKIGIVSKKQKIADFHRVYLQQLFGSRADIYAYSFERKNVTRMVSCDVFLITATAYDLMQDPWAESFMPPAERSVQAAITFSKKAIDLLMTYPEGTKALLANQTQHMAMETLTQLYNLGVSNINFTIYYPEMGYVPDSDLIFEPGDPEDALTDRPVIDLGNRFLNTNTISEIALRLGMPEVLESEAYEAYKAQLAEVDYSLQELAYQNLTADSKLELILNSMDAGIVCVDEDLRITLVNTRARDIFLLGNEEITGFDVKKRLPELKFRLEAKETDPALAMIRGQEYQITYTPILLKDKNLGAFAAIRRFEEQENAQIAVRQQKAQSLNARGTAKYTFADIIGESRPMQQAKRLAGRLAERRASVLIEGESGTGKELFAQAIHNASDRRQKPFVAVNCAALTETLLESELFGYVDGAFTGAKKGGREGMFEYAHQGTLFLDEIETMSLNLQAKLLRVLQEGEVTRIGSVQRIPVDVRVLSASNENVYRLVEQGSFRRDLYYRLNVIPLRIPALRERTGDILPLINHYTRSKSLHLEFDEAAKAALLAHAWPGNVRELRNCIEYFELMGETRITADLLPEQFHMEQAAAEPEKPAMPDAVGAAAFKTGSNAGGLRQPSEDIARQSGVSPFASKRSAKAAKTAILSVLLEYYQAGQGIGRGGLIYECMSRGWHVTEYDVRAVFKDLQQKDYLTTPRGRGGSLLTEAGFAYAEAEAAPPIV